MSDEIQVGATFHKKRVGKHIAMVEGPVAIDTQAPSARVNPMTLRRSERNMIILQAGYAKVNI